jgi:Domain of unknown function (DUF4062)
VAKTVARLKLFLSSTSELEAERALINEILAGVNRVIEELCGATIRLIDWRRDIVPGVSTDPQQIINSQTADCDIYVGILGTRFGSPTPRAGSGTEDEFNVAYTRFRTDPTSVRLLFYFRSGLAGSVLDVDPDQLRRVQGFRQRVGGERGVLFCDYGSPQEFITLLRDHLIQMIANQWNGSAWNPVPDLVASKAADVQRLVETSLEPTTEDDEEPEALDLRVELDDAFQSAMRALGHVSDSMTRGAATDRQWKMEADRVMALGVPAPKTAQELVNAKAKDFEQRARELKPLTATFRSAADEFFEKIGTLVELQIRTGLSTEEEMRAGIRKLAEADAGAKAVRDTYDQMAKSVASLRAPTREFKRQQRSLRTQIEQLSAAIASWLDRSAALQARFLASGPSGSGSDHAV